MMAARKQVFSGLRRKTSSAPLFETPPTELGQMKRLSVAAVLRASAGFPGIPPRRFRLIGDSWTSSSWPPWSRGALTFLSDGGIWNNLGTQASVEDHFFQGEKCTPSMVVLCLDASAGVCERSGWNFAIPGWAEIQDLWRSAMISNTNTVAPRRENFFDAFIKAVEEGAFSDPHPLVISLSESPSHVAFMLNRWLFRRSLKLAGSLDDLEANSEFWWEVWKGNPIAMEDDARLQDALGAISGRRSIWYRVVELLSSRVYREMCEIAGLEPPGHFFPISAPFNVSHNGQRDEAKFLEDFQLTLGTWAEGALKRQNEHDKGSQLDRAPTTLGAIKRVTARQLVARGYANTAIALYMLGLTDALPSPRENHPWLFEVGN